MLVRSFDEAARWLCVNGLQRKSNPRGYKRTSNLKRSSTSSHLRPTSCHSTIYEFDAHLTGLIFVQSLRISFNVWQFGANSNQMNKRSFEGLLVKYANLFARQVMNRRLLDVSLSKGF